MAKTNKVTFAIGQGFDKDQKPIEQLAEKMDGVLLIAAKMFGGYSADVIMGGWFNPMGLLIAEPSLIITVYTDKPVAVSRTFAEESAKLFNQESVLMTVETVDVMEFVGQPEVAMELPLVVSKAIAEDSARILIG